jgi:hypothetical protein
MSDQGGPNEAGWQPDPHGRHEYRYWDGAAWTDQVSDGGVVSTDPPGDATTVSTPATPPEAATAGMPVAGPPSTEVPAYAGPTEEKPKGKLPVGILALVGLAVAAVVAALVILLGGGDDGGGGGGGTGEFAGSITEDEPFVVRSFDLEAGEAIRVIIEPSDDLDATVTLGIDPDLATTQLFGFSDDADLLEVYGTGYGDLFSDAVPEDLSGDLSSAVNDDGDFSDLLDLVNERLPALEDAGIPGGTNNEHDAGEAEGSIFMAPLAGRYSIIVGGSGSTGDFDGKIDTTGPSDDFDEPDPDDDIDITDYYAGLAPLRNFLCDEDFWGGDPGDVSEQNDQICDDDSFDELLSTDFSDFSDDFSDFSDFSDVSDFSDDFSDLSDLSDLTDDFTDFSDFTDGGDLVDEDIGPIEVGDSLDGFIDAGTRDLYTFEGSGAVTIEVIGSFEQGGLDPIVSVLDSSGTELGRDDDGNPQGQRNSLLDITLDGGETYTIAVSGFTTSTGEYTVSVS